MNEKLYQITILYFAVNGTIEQIHRLANPIKRDLEANRFCSASFLDTSKAFGKVWYTELLHKEYLPHSHYELKSNPTSLVNTFR